MPRSFLRRLTCSAAALTLLSAAGAAAAKDVIIHAGTMLDGTLAKPRSHVSIVIRDDRIVGVEEGFVDRPGAEVIDLSRQTVLPGLIEGHDHLGSSNDRDDPPGQRWSNGDVTINVIRNAYVELESGFTSTRDAGTYNVDFKSIKRAIAKDRLLGPRIWASLEPLGPVGGHSDPPNETKAPLTTEAERDHALIHGPIDAREKVREHFLRGANVIKIMPSGGVSSVEDDPSQTTMTFDEMKAVVDAAHALGLRVEAHAHGLDAIRNAVRAGVDSIEHGTYGDEAIFKEMKARGTFLDPTIAVAYLKYETGKTHPEMFDPRVLAKGMVAWPKAINAATMGHRLGLKIGMGTDQSSLGAGLNKAVGIYRLTEAGFSPQEAIAAATSVNAEMLGSKDIGIIETGRYADIIAVDGDPLKDTQILQKVGFVMKGGRVYKRGGVMRPGP